MPVRCTGTARVSVLTRVPALQRRGGPRLLPYVPRPHTKKVLSMVLCWCAVRLRRTWLVRTRDGKTQRESWFRIPTTNHPAASQPPVLVTRFASTCRERILMAAMQQSSLTTQRCGGVVLEAVQGAQLSCHLHVLAVRALAMQGNAACSSHCW